MKRSEVPCVPTESLGSAADFIPTVLSGAADISRAAPALVSWHAVEP